MEADDEDDPVVAEYPLYAADIAALYSSEQGEQAIRLVHAQYPLRPPWRGYDFGSATEVQYKPEHGVLDMAVSEDQPAGVWPALQSCRDSATGMPGQMGLGKFQPQKS